MALNAGNLRHRITLNSPGAPDSYGQPGTPTTFASIWASVTAMTGSEVFKAQQYSSKATHLVKIRYLAGIQPNMTILWDNRSFQIEFWQDPDERKFELHIFCVERNTGPGSVA
jgi:SPP1 family predicted phage head-tail adaptor